MPRRKSGLQEDGIRELLEDLDVEDIGGDNLELPDWDFGEDDDVQEQEQEEVTFVNGLEVVRAIPTPSRTSPQNRYLD